MTPHSQYFPSNRSDTTSRPFKIIPGTSLCSLHRNHTNHWTTLVTFYPLVVGRLFTPGVTSPGISKFVIGGVHCWDESGWTDHDEEPVEIQAIHAEEVAFVTTWLEEFDLMSKN